MWAAKYMPEWKINKKDVLDFKKPNPLPYSYQTIIRPFPNAVRARLSCETFSSFPTSFYPESNLLPSGCSCGCGWKKSDEKFCQGIYFGQTFRKHVNVYYRRCLRNLCSWHYDGQSDGIFNYSGNTLMSYTLLQDLEVSCIKNAMTWKGFTNRMQDLYNKIFCDQEKKMPFVSEPTLGLVCCNFSFPNFSLLWQLLQIAKAYFEKLEAYEVPCIVCGVFPERIIVDASGIHQNTQNSASDKALQNKRRASDSTQHTSQSLKQYQSWQSNRQWSASRHNTI